jgi:xylulose-5-phosphate/fructose-6-phosphate phosphoketolase
MTPLATAVRPKAADSSDTTAERLSQDELQKMDAYWRACTYLAAGMIYLRSNPLLREPLKAVHI